MTECVVYPPHLADDQWFYLTHIIATPIIFGAGVLGNLVCIIVFNNKTLRMAHPTYAYLNGLGIMDFLGLCLMIPRYIQECEALPVQQTHSKVMAHLVNAAPGLSSMCTHSSTWYIVMASVLFLARVNIGHYKPSWTKISISRIVAFVIFAAAGLLNFPTFFEHSVKPVERHCMEGVELWGLHPTSLGQSIVYTSLYPWTLTGIVFLIPYTTLTILAIALPITVGIKKFCNKKTILRKVHQDEEKMLQLGKSLFSLTMVFIVLETPHNVGELLLALYGKNQMEQSEGFNQFVLVSELLRRIRMTVPFIIYALYDGEFRKCIRRVLCCTGDEYYEPCACCCTSVLEQEQKQFHREKQNGVAEEMKNGYFVNGKRNNRRGSEHSSWL